MREVTFGANVATYPFEGLVDGLKENALPAGGLHTVIKTELDLRSTDPAARNNRLDILVHDSGSLDLSHANSRVIGSDSDVPLDPSIYGVWFNEGWSMIHPDAFTKKGYSKDVLEQMFRGEYSTPWGSIERIQEHHTKYGADSSSAEASFVRRLEPVIMGIEPGSVVNWQDYFFVPVMNRHAERLRENGSYQTYHHHMSFPRELDQFPQGRRLLETISKMDEVFVHTDDETAHVHAQLERLGLRLPKISRFDLGINQLAIKEGLNAVHKNNYKDHPQYKVLSDQQKAAIKECFDTQDSTPHRFISIDRIDPIKGNSVLIEGIDKYLSSLGISADEMRDNYRFFFFMEFFDDESIDTFNLKHQYSRYVKERFQELQEKYPGIVHISSSIPRAFVPAILKGAHIMSGAIQDGLNLAVQEALHVNAQTEQDTTGIIGMGAGFAVQTLKHPEGRDLVYFTRVGNSSDVATSIRETVITSTEQQGAHRAKTQEINKRFIVPRQGTIFVRPS